MEVKKFQVESNVEINNKSYKKRGRIPKYEFPFSTMEVGDTFLVEKNTKTIQSYLINRANNFCQSKKLNWKFTTHKVDEGYRVIRIK
jgi:hypothetical protein